MTSPKACWKSPPGFVAISTVPRRSWAPSSRRFYALPPATICKFSGGGNPPLFQTWQRQQISDNPRYLKTVEHFGYLAQQATIFGQHVHVGCQNGDDALYLYMACRASFRIVLR